jgi:hypothetical protein
VPLPEVFSDKSCVAKEISLFYSAFYGVGEMLSGH